MTEFAKGGPVTGHSDQMPFLVSPSTGYVLSARQVRELGEDAGLLAKLNGLEA